MSNNVKGYLIWGIVILLTFILAIIYGCDSSAGTINYQRLYNEQLIFSKVLKAENDSLKIKIDYLQDLIVKIDSVYRVAFSESLSKIDSLKNALALQDSIRDADTIIMLQSIQYGLEHISDEGLKYLIELRKK